MSMINQIDQLKQGISKLKQQKQLVEGELKLIEKNQIQIQNALIDSKKVCEQLQHYIQVKQQQNSKNFKKYEDKIKQLTQKLSLISNQNHTNSQQYHQITRNKRTQRHNSILDTILSLQTQQFRNKKISKKIYTKNQIQQMLRALYLILKLSQLNYGNIIQHLIVIAETAEKGKKVNLSIHNKIWENQLLKVEKKKSMQQSQNGQNKTQQENFIQQQRQFYITPRGQQISIYQLVKILQKELLRTQQTKFISKMLIIQFYQQKKLKIQLSPHQPGQFIQQTQKNISKVVEHYVKITSWFSRVEKRNIQLSQYYKDLQKIDDDLQTQINSMQLSSTQKHIKNLQQRQNQMDNLSDKINTLCSIIFKFNIYSYDLIKRCRNLNQLFQKIVKSTNRKTLKKTYVQLQNDNNFLKNFIKILFKSPENIILDWNNVMKNNNTVKRRSVGDKEKNQHQSNQSNNNAILNASLSSQKLLEKLPDHQIFLEKIMKNDLLRIYSLPTIFQYDKPYLYNIQKTFNYVIKEEKKIVQNLGSLLRNVLLFSKKGIQQFMKKKQEQQADKDIANKGNNNKPNKLSLFNNKKSAQKRVSLLNNLAELLKIGQQGGQENKNKNVKFQDKQSFESSAQEQSQQEQQRSNKNSYKDNNSIKKSNAKIKTSNHKQKQLQQNPYQINFSPSSQNQYKNQQQPIQAQLKPQTPQTPISKQQQQHLQLKQLKQINKKRISFNPLLMIMQGTGNQTKWDKFFQKDQIKQKAKNKGNIVSQYDHKFCVESKDYFRRDNFKIIQKLERIEQKKKGLFDNLPFMVNTSLELQTLNNNKNVINGNNNSHNVYNNSNLSMSQKPLNLIFRSTTRLNSINYSPSHNTISLIRSPRLSLKTNRHNQLSQRRQKQNLRKKNLRILLNNISNIAAQNHKYRIKKNLKTKGKQYNFTEIPTEMNQVEIPRVK